jgi:hypothetical protein
MHWPPLPQEKSLVLIFRGTEEVETTNFLGLQIDGNFNWNTCRVYYPSMNFCMLCNRDSHTNHEKRKPKITLFCLQAVMLNGMIFWQTSTDTKKVILYPKEK